jgi:hypothetical protein
MKAMNSSTSMVPDKGEGALTVMSSISFSLPFVARMEPPGPASGRPDDKLRVIRELPFQLAPPLPDYAALHPAALREGAVVFTVELL